MTYEDHDEVDVEPAEGDGCPLELVFVPVADPKSAKNRVHLDLASPTASAQAETVARAEALGARRVDIGQGNVPWVVLADPEGNEFCVLDPRPEYADTGALAAVVVDTTDVAASVAFWHAAAGWDVLRPESLRHPDRRGPWLEFLPAAPKTVKNRLHLDVAPYPDDTLDAEATRLRGLGATPADIGQGDVPWVVLTDPQGSEFCILSPR
ncbi:VOC family protein [Actinokineospora soli]|uniref:VOC family protein n=1 Tax=Actinokineospora soli TaxID=1048753 RepID=A0ABW2TJ72_9PSEU